MLSLFRGCLKVQFLYRDFGPVWSGANESLKLSILSERVDECWLLGLQFPYLSEVFLLCLDHSIMALLLHLKHLSHINAVVPTPSRFNAGPEQVSSGVHYTRRVQLWLLRLCLVHDPD